MAKNIVITWGDIKLASLQKMFSSDGTTIKMDNSNREYIYGMPHAANEALQRLATVGKFLLGEYTIVNRPIEPAFGHMGNHQIINDSVTYYAVAVKSYYFRAQGQLTVRIHVEDAEPEDDTILTIDKPGTYDAYTGFVENPNGKNVSFTFSATYPANVKNIALYDVAFQSVDDIPPYEEFMRFDLSEILDDFYQLAPNEIYYEGDEEPRYIAADRYYQEANSTLVIPRDEVGAFTIYYRRYPNHITQDTPDTYVLPLDPEVAVLMPLYIASELYKDDDNSIATIYRNEFEVALGDLTERADVPQFEEFESVTGWV